ncbi:MAG: hypothetical protein Q8K85_10475 [Hyphomicrobium sp.]|nr:hypothetical protein [Hyphomicrobium sp.]
MISLMVASAIGLTALQAGIDGPRKNFVACLKGAFDSALTQNVASPDYGAFIIRTCTAQADSLRSGLIGFDLKNGIRRTQAAADAQAQIDDYVAMSTEKYESKLAVSKPQAAAPAATVPPPTPASAPKN